MVLVRITFCEINTLHLSPMENSPVIRVNDVTKLFGKVTGVKDISLIVEKGDIFGFLGPNGSGKTTTIRLLLDLLRPDKGVIEVFGKELRKYSFEIRQKCGYLPGNFNAYGNLTGMAIFAIPRAFQESKPVQSARPSGAAWNF